MQISSLLLSLLISSLVGCAGHPAPEPTESVAVYSAPQEPRLIANDLLPKFKYSMIMPPAKGSRAQKKDEAELRKRQAERTPADCARANTEVHANLDHLFGPINGPLTAEEVEPLKDFFEKIRNDADFYIQTLKKEFPRERPFVYMKDLEPCVPKELTGAYPSGHATISKLEAMILGDLYPRRKSAFLARADVIAGDRVLAGMHHPTDIQAGKMLGARLYRKFRQSPAYDALFQDIWRTVHVADHR